MLTDLEVSRTKTNSGILIYKKESVVLYKYNEKYNVFYIDYKKIWWIFHSKYKLNYDEIKLLTKDMVEKYLNLKNITIRVLY
jgi:hypothetical protein